MDLGKRVAELGLELPEPPDPAGDYLPVKVLGETVHVSGQGPLLAGGGFVCGKVGAGLTLEQGKEAARLAALSALVVLDRELGDLDLLLGIGRIVGYVNCAPGFNATPAVMDGCSRLMAEVLGERGRHARSAVGVAELPFDIAVEIDVTAHLKPPGTRPRPARR